LESLETPAALVDSDLKILSSNRQLGRIVETLSRDLSGTRIGEAMGCAHALDHPCGEADACDQCSLKRLVEVTRISGEKMRELPVIFLHKNGFSEIWVCTTERAGNAVILSIWK